MSLEFICCVFFFQAEDGIRDLVRSRGLGDVYKRQAKKYGIQLIPTQVFLDASGKEIMRHEGFFPEEDTVSYTHLTLPTSDLV